MGTAILAIGFLLLSPAAMPQEGKRGISSVAEDLSSPEFETRRKTAWELWQRRDEAFGVAAALVAALRDPDAYVRDTCARAMEGFVHRIPDLLPAVAEGLRDERPEVRRLAAWVLVRAQGEVRAVRDPLLRTISEDADEGARANAAQALRCLPLPEAGPALPVLRAAARDPFAAVRVEAIATLGALRDAGLADLAAEAVADQAAEVRAEMLNVLHHLHLHTALPLARVTGLARDPEWTVRWRAAFLLGDYPAASPGQVDVLLAAVEDENAWVRTAATQSLGRAGPVDPRVVPALAEALSDEAGYVVTEAAEALGNIGPGAAGALRALATAVREQGDGAPRFAAMAAIDRIAGPLMDAVLPAIEADAGRDPCPSSLRAAAILVRLRGRDDESLRYLLDALVDPEVAPYSEVILLDLAGVSPGARRALQRVSEGEDLAAADASFILARRSGLAPEAAVARLTELLESKTPGVAARAAERLRAIR